MNLFFSLRLSSPPPRRRDPGVEDADAGGESAGRWRSRWAPPRTIYAEEEEGYIPKVIANPPVVGARGGRKGKGERL